MNSFFSITLFFLTVPGIFSFDDGRNDSLLNISVSSNIIGIGDRFNITCGSYREVYEFDVILNGTHSVFVNMEMKYTVSNTQNVLESVTPEFHNISSKESVMTVTSRPAATIGTIYIHCRTSARKADGTSSDLFSAIVKIDVGPKPTEVSLSLKKYKSRSASSSFKRGDKVEVICSATMPLTSGRLTLFLDNEAVDTQTPSTRGQKIVINEILIFDEPKMYNNKILKCLAGNVYGKVADAKNINIIYSPKVEEIKVNGRSDLEQEITSSVDQVCSASGNPTPSIRWLLTENTVFKSKGNDTIFIDEAQMKNLKEILFEPVICLVSKDGGAINKTFTFKVVPAPAPVNVSFIIFIIFLSIYVIMLIYFLIRNQKKCCKWITDIKNRKEVILVFCCLIFIILGLVLACVVENYSLICLIPVIILMLRFGKLVFKHIDMEKYGQSCLNLILNKKIQNQNKDRTPADQTDLDQNESLIGNNLAQQDVGEPALEKMKAERDRAVKEAAATKEQMKTVEAERDLMKENSEQLTQEIESLKGELRQIEESRAGVVELQEITEEDVQCLSGQIRQKESEQESLQLESQKKTTTTTPEEFPGTESEPDD